MKIDGAIFDLDGTLIDSMLIWDDLSSNLLKSFGVTPKPDLRDRVSTMYLDESSRYVVEEYGLKVTPEEISAYLHSQVEDFYLNRVQPKEDVIEFLEKLKNNGVRMCVATATERRLAEPALRHNDMLKFFDAVFTCKEVGCNKSSPLVFEKSLEFLGTPRANTFVFEDSLHAVQTAAAAGFPVAGIYDNYSAKNAAEIERASTCYFKKYAELDTVLEQLRNL